MPRYKRYQLINSLGLLTHFHVNGSSVTVDFRGGMKTPMFTPGRFGTSDPDLQKAIEESKGFNVQYKLEYDSNPEAEEIIEQANEPVDFEISQPESTEDNQPPTEEPEGAENAPETPEQEKAPEETPEAPEAPEAPEQPEAPEVTDYPEILTVTDAKEKLMNLFEDVKISHMRNRNDVLAIAQVKKVSFSKMK